MLFAEPDGLAECFYRTGRRELMLAMLQQALEVDPRCDEAARLRALTARVEAQRAQIVGVRSGAAASIAGLPFPDDTFDRVVAIEVLEHIPLERVEPALRELWRVSRHHVFVTVQNTMAAEPAHFFADLTHVSMKPLAWWQNQFTRVGFDLRADELPLGEFRNHQIVASPRHKYAEMPSDVLQQRCLDQLGAAQRPTREG